MPRAQPALGALFLDEGFGTLDAVRSTRSPVLEGLSGEGRLVGIITRQ